MFLTFLIALIKYKWQLCTKNYRFNGYNWYNISRSQTFFYISINLFILSYYEKFIHYKSIIQILNCLEFWYTHSNPFHLKQNDKTLSLIKIRLFTFSLYMRHEIYATTFYGPLCLFGKNTFIRINCIREEKEDLYEMKCMNFGLCFSMKAVTFTSIN